MTTTRFGRRSLGIAAIVTGALLAAPVFARMLDSVFQGASPGVAVPAAVVPLPDVAVAPGTPGDQPTPQAIIALADDVIAASGGAAPATTSGVRSAARDRCAFAPTVEQLVTGETVITTDAQMQLVWSRLFAEPYDATLFDFEESFVVLMGGGAAHPLVAFSISSVEQFEATFDDPFADGTETALAIVATTLLPGVLPPPADPEYKVAAVAVPRAFLDEAIFSRQVLAAP